MTEGILPIDRHKLVEARKAWESVLVELKGLECNSPERRQWWSEKMVVVQTFLTDLELERLGFTKPLNDDLRKVNAAYRETATLAEQAKELIKSKVAAFDLALEEEAAKTRLAAMAAAEAGDHAGAAEALKALPTQTEKSVGTATTFEWVVEAVNLKDLPLEYHLPNDALLKDYCKKFKPELGDVPVLAGVTFKKQARVRALPGAKK